MKQTPPSWSLCGQNGKGEASPPVIHMSACSSLTVTTLNLQSQVHPCTCKALGIMMIAGTAVTSYVAHKQIPGPLCRGNYDGPEPQRLAVLKYAAHLGASHVDVELKVATYFFAGECSNLSAEGHSASNTLHMCSVALLSLRHLQVGMMHLECTNIMLKIFYTVSILPVHP